MAILPALTGLNARPEPLTNTKQIKTPNQPTHRHEIRHSSKHQPHRRPPRHHPDAVPLPQLLLDGAIPSATCPRSVREYGAMVESDVPSVTLCLRSSNSTLVGGLCGCLCASRHFACFEAEV